MLLLTFDVSGSRYAVDVSRVVVVVPRVPLRPIPHAPEYLAGLFRLGEELVPVVDLGLRLGGAACRPRLSTRIVVVESAGRRLGLVAERVIELRHAPDGLFAADPEAPRPGDAPYLGPIAALDGELVQAILVEKVLPEALHETLYAGMLRRP